jgi:hypothetical protein
VLPHLSSNHSLFIHQSSLAVTSRYLTANQQKLGEKWPWILPTKYLCYTPQGFLPYKILLRGTDGFTSPPKEVVLRICSDVNIVVSLKNAFKGHRLQPGAKAQKTVCSCWYFRFSPRRVRRWLSSGLLCCVVCSPDDGGVNTFETSAKLYQTTRRNIPEGHYYMQLISPAECGIIRERHPLIGDWMGCCLSTYDCWLS